MGLPGGIKEMLRNCRGRHSGLEGGRERQGTDFISGSRPLSTIVDGSATGGLGRTT